MTDSSATRNHNFIFVKTFIALLLVIDAVYLIFLITHISLAKADDFYFTRAEIFLFICLNKTSNFNYYNTSCGLCLHFLYICIKPYCVTII